MSIKSFSLMMFVLICLSACGQADSSAGGDSSYQDDSSAVATAREKLTFDSFKNDNTASDLIFSDLALPTSGSNETVITWSSDNPDVISDTGAVNRPGYSQGNITVELTATISKGSASATAAFTLTVIKTDMTDEEAVAAAKTDLTFDSFKNGNSLPTAIYFDLALPASGSHNTSIAWSSNNHAINADTGAVIRPSGGEANAVVTMTAVITKETASMEKLFELIVIRETSDAEAVATAKSDLIFDDIKNANLGENDIQTDLNLPVSGTDGTSISWSSDNTAVIANDGTVVRPEYSEPNVSVELTATISRGLASDTKTFTLTVTRKAQTDEQAVADAKGNLTFDDIKNTNLGENNVQSDLNLSTTGTDGTSISWSSDNTAVITNTGTVVRPEYNEANVVVELTATISKGSASETKIFTLTVIKKVQTDVQSVAATKAALTFDSIRNANREQDMIWSSLNLITSGGDGTTIAWQSTNESTVSTVGSVTRPGSGVVAVDLTATISKGSASDTKVFSLILPPKITVRETGQTTCYNGDGTVISSCPAPGSALAQDASYTTSGNTFTDNGNGTVSDSLTGLMWEQKTPANKTDKTTPGGALAYCNGLSLQGHVDWRVPTPIEMNQIMLHNGVLPTLDQTYFPNTTPIHQDAAGFVPANYWTSKPYAGDSINHWFVPIAVGHLWVTGKSAWHLGIRCVRGAESDPSPRFSSYGDGNSVKDLKTGLIWVKGETELRNWEDSLNYCEQVENTGGYSDWRLPSKNELMSLIDYDQNYSESSVLDATVFNGMQKDAYWTSTTDNQTADPHPEKALVVRIKPTSDGVSGAVNGQTKSENLGVRCVRGR